MNSWDKPHRGDREPTGLLGGLEGPELAIAGVLAILVPAALVILTGIALAALVTGSGWVWPPLAQTPGVLVGVVAHRGAPADAYPTALSARVPSAPWCWSMVVLVALIAYVLLFAVALRVMGRAQRSRSGLASSAGLTQDTQGKRRTSGRGRGRGGAAASTGSARRTGLLSRLRHRRGVTPPPEAASYRADSLLPSPYAMYDGRPVLARAEDTGCVLAPPRSGKTMRLAIPLVADAVGAVVATSTRPDLYDHTELARAQRGRVFVFDPDGLTGLESVRWDPVAGCADPRTATVRARSMVAARAGASDAAESGSTNIAFFDDAATRVLSCLLHAADLVGASMRDVLGWARDSTDNEPYLILRQNPQAATGWVMDLTRFTRSSATQTTAAIATSLSLVLDPLSIPQVLDVLCPPRRGTGFDVESFLDSTDTIYLLSAGAETSTGSLTTALLADIDRLSRVRAAASPTGRISPPLTLVLDEAANIAALPTLPSLMSEGGGRGVATWAFFQSAAQMQARWGAHGGTTILDAAAIKLVFGGLSDDALLRRLSALCGERLVRRASVSSGRSGSSRSTSLQREPVLSEADLRELPAGQALLLYRSTPPAVVFLPAWWEREDAARFATGVDDGFAQLPRSVGTPTEQEWSAWVRRTSRPSWLMFWVEVAELGAGVGGGEVPVDLPLVVVGLLLPGGELGVEDVEVGDTPVQALTGQGGELDLGDVQPGAVLGGVVDL